MKKGKIFISSLKPYNDLSLVYRDFIEQHVGGDDLQEGRKLLSAAGKIIYKEKHGHYKFFTETELANLLRSNGIAKIKTFRSLGNQVNIAVGEKA